VADDLEADEAFFARILQGRRIADEGGLGAAETHFRGLLAEARGGHVGNQAAALSALITVYGRSGRYVEAHLLARRLAAMAEAVGPPADRRLAFARAAECGALAKMHLVEGLRPALARLREVLDRTPGSQPGLELEYCSAAGTHAIAVGDLPRARHHVTTYRQVLEGAEGLEPLFRWALVMAEGRMAFLEGHPEIAQRLLARVRAAGLTPPHHRLGELPLEVAIHVALGHGDAARTLATEALALLEAVEDVPFVASSCIHIGTDIARECEAMGAWDLAQRASDCIAAAVMIRLRQVDECMHDLPELGLDDGDAAEVLAGFRKQFLREQRLLLQRVAGRLEAQGGDAIRTLLGVPERAGHIAVCAWCESVRPAKGRWLPIGHFIPREGSLRVTHGICPSCAHRSVAAPASA
jgi:hypothetical protein